MRLGLNFSDGVPMTEETLCNELMATQDQYAASTVEKYRVALEEGRHRTAWRTSLMNQAAVIAL